MFLRFGGAGVREEGLVEEEGVGVVVGVGVVRRWKL